MTRTICLWSAGRLVCVASPVRDCSCDRDESFKDPYPETPAPSEDPKRALDDIAKVLELWSKSGDTAGGADKLHALSAITRLVLTKGVDLSLPFVISSLENGNQPSPQAR